MAGRKKEDRVVIPFKDHDWGVLVRIPVQQFPVRVTNIVERRLTVQYAPEDVKCGVCGQRYTNAKNTKCPGVRKSTGA